MSVQKERQRAQQVRNQRADEITKALAAVTAKDAEIARLRREKARLIVDLQFIAGLEPGNRGAYAKFASAKARAVVAIERSATETKGEP